MTRIKPSFKTETELCNGFISCLPQDWTAYAETAGWDILLANKDGTQIGVQAKLRFNMAVLEQAIGHPFFENDRR